MTSPTQSFGEQLRGWRQRRRLSQLDLALDAEVSQRHLSFLESGRSTPSRDMVIRLAERISIPPRERNALLVAAGFAPQYRERPLDDPSLQPARERSKQFSPPMRLIRRWPSTVTGRW
jgi:transcriptional regulator with XRE-family HTH domain